MSPMPTLNGKRYYDLSHAEIDAAGIRPAWTAWYHAWLRRPFDDEGRELDIENPDYTKDYSHGPI